jgi:hypothetical protein
LAIFLSSSLVKFSLFRVLPVALVSSVASAYVIKLEASVPKFSILYFAIYISALVAFRFASRYRFGRRVSIRDVMWLLVASLFTLTGTILGFIGAPLVEGLLPGPSISRDALFTALLVAATIAFMQRIMLDEDISDKAIRRAIDRGRSLASLVEAEARRNGIARWLLPSVVIAEQMQRPKWFQSIESMAYSVGLPVTVGPFQGAHLSHGRLVDQVAEFMVASPAADFAMHVKLGDDWNANGVERATYALHNDAKPFVDLCQRVRELLIEDEFEAAVTPYELNGSGVEFGPLRLRSSIAQEFMFKVHLPSDFGRDMNLLLCKFEDLPDVTPEVLSPGGTLEFHAYGSDVDSEWVIRASGDDALDVKFRPMRDLEFKTSWDG